ncbi:MAG: nitrite reductase large subunit [Anaerolineaceae bacterium]|nr:nitrite reductase large subunit [Anaerolineaceae bacterium]
MSNLPNLVVIGNGMVGYKFIEKFTAFGGRQAYQLVTFCEEPRPAYDRVHLSEYFSGKTADDLSLAPQDWYQEQGVELHLGDAVVEIDREAKLVRSKNGLEIPYDKIVLATGSTPFVPPVPGIDKTGVFVYRTIEDLDAIIEYSDQCKTAAVIGGGLLGLEAAKALVDLKLETHVVEFAPRLMPRQIDQTGSDFLRSKIEELAVKIHLNKNTKHIVGNGSVQGMAFADESELTVDMIVVSAGIRPRDELARSAGLTVGERGGILVNDEMQTSDPDIYAIGECALHGNMIYGLVAPGYRMAETAARQLLAEEVAFTGADMSTKLKLMGVDVASIGNAFANGSDSAEVTFANSHAGVYKKLVMSKTSNTLKGAILVGDANEYGQLLQMYLNDMPLPEAPESLIVKSGDAPAGFGVDSLPETAQICSCENVTKGEIISCIKDGCQTVPAIKQQTKACTGCGSCTTLVTDLLNTELEKMGVAVDKSLCEHFAYTRQELVEIIKLGQIKSFDELLSRYGKGRGCEICKPAVASILASTWNDYVMEHQTIQDTNDYYMANMQRNGTYSVVPRVPGGEITPDQLIAMGEVAKEFNLYTKITGGQRIDLFGAHLEDLPKIWKKLGEVGLETGQAYAKSVRTVKSCVGSTWCRYGVQDSTTLAIDIENRYKGLRSPHKLKFAVSGCARECAEAQGKDVGVIATEKGWNLYVCGNGGMKPQHAQLLANDIDTETVIKYIDRFLMYYVRTADKLTRTATWLNKLPGGLDKVKDVVINDSLGLAEELEREMQHVVDTFQCEWQTTVNSPEKVKRFRHFINAPEKDPNIEFITLRTQPVPA